MENRIGKKAPAFKGKNQNGKTVQLSDYIGNKLALYFYPKDMTPGCTAQACNLKENYALLQKNGIRILGVSADDADRHARFIEKYDLPFDLIADPEHEIIEKYGVWQLKKFMGKEYMGIVRTTFLIDEKGQIAHIITKPKTKIHAEEILETWQ